jgi:hypothetical protein
MIINIVPTDSEHVQAYWRNILSLPDNAQNPMNDKSGNSFDIAQGGNASSAQGGNVLYFVGNNAENHTRNIPHPIPTGNSLFVGVNPVVIVDSEAAPDTNLSGIAEADENTASRAFLTIETQFTISTITFDLLKGDLGNFRCPTGDVQLTAPTDGTLFGVPAGPHNAAADGYYAIVQPLDPGNYTMTIDARVEQPFKQQAPWTSSVTYNFDVVGPAQE